MTDDVEDTLTNEQLLDGMTFFPTSKREIDEASAKRRAGLKRLKEQGYPLEVMKLAEKLRQRGREAATDFVKNLLHLCWITKTVDEGHPTAGLDLRVTNQAAEQWAIAEAADRGYREGRRGGAADANPYPAGSDLAAEYEKHRRYGAKNRVLELGDKATAATAEKRNPRKLKAPGTEEGGEVVVKRRGRPPGAKNRPKAVMTAGGVVRPAKRRGRKPRAANGAEHEHQAPAE